MQNKKDSTSKDTSMRLKQIAKIIFLLICFRIVMDSPMWIVLSFLIFMGIYVLPAYILKHLKSGLLQAMLNSTVSKAKTWYSQNVNDHDDKPKEESKIHFVIKNEEDINNEPSEDGEIIVDTTSDLCFKEDSYHTIWNPYDEQ